MTAFFQELIAEVMADIDRAEKTVSVFVQKEENGIGNAAAFRFLEFQVLEVTVEIPRIVSEDRPR